MQNIPDDSFCVFGAEALIKRLNSLKQEIEGVTKAEDPECIHKMRVASRRVRSAFNIFEECFNDKDIKRWKKQLRQVTRALGSARDLDVQIDFLQNFLANVTQTRFIPGIKRLLLRLKQKRLALQPKIISAMDQLRKNSVIENITEASHIMQNIGRLHQKDEYSISVYERAYMAISLRLEEFLSYKEYAKDPKNTTEIHSMRISAKRLRYTMEIFASLYKDELKHPIESVRDFQTILGDFNDCVVWSNFLPQFIEEEKRRTIEYFGNSKPFSRLKSGILYFQEEMKKRQAEQHRIFLEYWEKELRQDTWGNLIKCIFNHVLMKRGNL